MKNSPLVFLLPLFLLVFCNQPQTTQSAVAIPSVVHRPPSAVGKINGLTFVAPPEPFPQNPMTAVQSAGASWIAVVPYAFLRPGTSQVRFDENGGHWWGERPVGVKETVRLAHEAGIKVMMKPQVWIPNHWTFAR